MKICSENKKKLNAIKKSLLLGIPLSGILLATGISCKPSSSAPPEAISTESNEVRTSGLWERRPEETQPAPESGKQSQDDTPERKDASSKPIRLMGVIKTK